MVAIRNGIGIAGIDLWMFGGVAKMERDTDSPGVEFRVAVAGPLVTLAIAAAASARQRDLGPGRRLAGIAASRPRDLSGAAAVLGYLLSINVLVLLFNLIPGFPLDGGRIARGDRLVADRRPQPCHPLRRPAGAAGRRC